MNWKTTWIFIALFSVLTASAQPQKGSVIFIHPDGAGLGLWNALRLLKEGPDGMLAWDTMESLAIYRGHQKNWLSTTSHAGATAHAFGKKVHYDSFGMDRDQPLASASGYQGSLMKEAMNAGIRVGVVNSGHIAEPGTAVFLASSEQRSNTDLITSEMIESGAPVIFSGGETLMLPPATTGHFGFDGKRLDGRNLIEEAKAKGYKVIYTREALMNLPSDTDKVLGVFAPYHTFNDLSEEKQRQLGLKHFRQDAPTLDEMTKVALRILSHGKEPFFLVVEEEGTDNFSNDNNASGALEALWRADDAIASSLDFIGQNPETLLITAADSDAGHPVVFALRDPAAFGKPLPERDENGAPMDGQTGTGSIPFVARPDQFGEVYEFGITWATYKDMQGSVIVRAHGLNARLMPANVHNTDVYRMMYATLFGKLLPWEAR